MSEDVRVSWPFNLDRVNEWAYCLEAFTPDECKEIISHGLSKNLITPLTGADNKVNPKIRKGNISWMYPTKDTFWLYRKLTDITLDLNNKFFNFDLFGITEPLQFSEYKTNNGHYLKHTDRKCGFLIRKLSLSVQLTNPSKYSGGELILHFDTEEIKTVKEQGSVIAFPSYVLHEVTPVTKGTRYSLVFWVTGKNFI